MEYVEIDCVLASTLEEDDVIKYEGGYREIVIIEDMVDFIYVETDNGEELQFEPDAQVCIYGIE